MRHRIRAAALIAEADRILLVCHQQPRTGKQFWVPPGGGLEEIDDSIFACAQRETFEETGLEVVCRRIVYLREFTQPSRDRRHLEMFLLGDRVSGDRVSGEPTLDHLPPHAADSDWIVAAAWISRTELEPLTVYPEILKRDFWTDRALGFPQTRYLGNQLEGCPDRSE